MTRRFIAVFCVLLFALLPLTLAASAQEGCDPTYEAVDYRLYALDAALLGDFESAHALYDCWIEAFPEDGSAYYERAAVRAGLEADYDGALADLDAAAALNESALTDIRRAFVLLKMGDFDGVITSVTTYQGQSGALRLPEITALLLDAYQQRGIARIEAGDYEAGLEDLMLAFEDVDEDELTADDAPAVLAVGQAFAATGQYEQAVRAYTAYITLAGADADPDIVTLVEAFDQMGLAAFFAGSVTLRAQLATDLRFFAPNTPFAFSADSSVLGVGVERRIQLYDTATGEALAAFDTLYSIPGTFALNADGTRAASITAETTVSVFDTRTGEGIFEIEVTSGTNRLHAITFAGDEIIALTISGEVHRFDAEGGDERARSDIGDTIPPLAVAFFNAAGTQAALSMDTDVRIYRLNGGAPVEFRARDGRAITSWDSALRFAAAVSPNGEMSVWSPSFGGTMVATFDFEDDISVSAGLDASGAKLAYGDEGGLVTVIDLLTNTHTVVGVHDERIAYVGISPDGRLVAALDTAGALRLWEVGV